MARTGLTKNSRVALKSMTRVFCRVPVQGFGGPRRTPIASRVRLHCVGLLKFDAASMSNMQRPTRTQWSLTREAFGVRRGPQKPCTWTQQNTRVALISAMREFFLQVRGGPLMCVLYFTSGKIKSYIYRRWKFISTVYLLLIEVQYGSLVGKQFCACDLPYGVAIDFTDLGSLCNDHQVRPCKKRDKVIPCLMIHWCLKPSYIIIHYSTINNC